MIYHSIMALSSSSLATCSHITKYAVCSQAEAVSTISVNTGTQNIQHSSNKTNTHCVSHFVFSVSLANVNQFL